ncbi:hypothetical protein PLESTB_000385700 [Pleodorina starrii]|uniref:NAD-dependent epimerase/dehydratase domain-containing protein n=1 Tax=Pleodorina starrii TaxID=330485 RepID=A0A9W6BE92_9CHLO|nr:hypothetical protein PLESTB_000385700 [Pleodorina starrii]GLC73268.1 hypothetical protein PLESTF_001354200 [Pleodorina starrii]
MTHSGKAEVSGPGIAIAVVARAGGAATGAAARSPAAPGLLQRVPLFPTELSAPKSRVCVTGATGYIAGPIIERLLRAGHTVHGTCRDPSNLTALSPLMDLPGASERLRLFKADLMVPGSFDAAVQGCDYVIHVAAPVLLSKVKPSEGRSKVVDPMVRGVDNVLGAVDRAPSVKRVVMTSSVAALCAFNLDPRNTARAGASARGATTASVASPPLVYGPDDWNDGPASETSLPYLYGKTQSERRAWELAAAAQGRWQLVTVLPSLVFGPTVCACASSESVAAVRGLMRKGGRGVPAVGRMGLPAVDVRDVAAVHCLAMVTSGASGRYIAHAHDSTAFDCTHAVAARFPKFRPARRLLPFWLVWLAAPRVGLNRDLVRAMWGAPPRFDTRRTCADLGLSRWVPLEDSLEDMIRDMAGKGMVRLR